MTDTREIRRCREFCARCGQFMFEFYRSPDGHFGIVGDIGYTLARRRDEVQCPTCGARYRLLDRLNEQGKPVARAGWGLKMEDSER